MALSPRANLIREMSRASRASSDAGSDHISAKDFAGTDSEQQLPGLPAFTPERYIPHHEQDYRIDTSQLQRAFPNFSQDGSSDEDSIEAGRGLGSRNPNRTFPSEEPSENISLTFGNEKYTVTGTPPLKPRKTSLRTAPQNTSAKMNARSTSEKENHDPVVKHTSYGSSSSSDAAQKKPTSMFQNVEEEDSIPLPSRAKSPYASAKSTRFTSPPTRQPLAETNNTPNRQPSQTVNGGTYHSVNSPAAGTYQSFALPDMPNMTELLTGSRRDATPTANKSARATSRISAPSSLRKLYNPKDHKQVSTVPVPEDAKALYLSLQLLQEKVKGLEKQCAQAEKKADGYELELLQLRSQVEEQQPAAKSENIHSDERWAGERAKFEKLIKSLQNRLKQNNQKDSASDATIKVLEVQELELRAKIQRREKAIDEMSGMVKQLWNTRRRLARSGSHQRASSRGRLTSALRSSGNVQRVHEPTSATTIPKGDPPRRRSNLDESVTLEMQKPKRQASDAQPVQYTGVERHATQTLYSIDDLERCETYLSFMEGDEVAKLRQVLQEDKARLASAATDMDVVPRKSSLKDVTKSSKKQQVSYEDDSADEVCQEITTEITRPLSRASVCSRQSQHVGDEDPFTREVESEPELTQNMTKQSVRSNQSAHRRRKSAPDTGVHDDNMTSAYILPDITMTGAALANTVQPKTTKLDFEQGNEEQRKLTATISRAIPVSERPVSPTPSYPDPTIRPSREPGVALNLVIHSLESEIARLREQIAKFEDLYNQTDPSLSKRRRKAVWARILKIGDAIERRADQVYALYDVLEGLKAGGIEMKEEEVEVTLAELGLPKEYVEKAVGAQVDRRKAKDSEDEGAFEGDAKSSGGEDVWEGFEDTQEA